MDDISQPTIRVTFDAVPPSERLEKFREGSPTHRVSLPDGRTEDELSADVTVWPIGRAMVLRSRLGPSVWERTREHIRADRLDHIQFNLTLSGRSDYSIAGREHPLVPGTLIVIDYGCPTRGVIMQSIENITLTIPRNEFSRFPVDLRAANGLVLSDASSALIAGHFRALVDYLPQATRTEAARVLDATTALVAACLPKRDDVRRSSATNLSSNALRLFIEENAIRPECDVAFVQRTFGLSRPTLYRLSEPIGGVASYIVRCRLEHAANMIRASPTKLSIVRISRSCGFKSAAHFARLFRQRFGHPPSHEDVAKQSVGSGPIPQENRYQRYARLVGAAGGRRSVRD